MWRRSSWISILYRLADLNAAGHYPTYDERKAMAEYVENHNLFPHQRQSWQKALAATFPKYLTAEASFFRASACSFSYWPGSVS